MLHGKFQAQFQVVKCVITLYWNRLVWFVIKIVRNGLINAKISSYSIEQMSIVAVWCLAAVSRLKIIHGNEVAYSRLWFSIA